MRERERKRERGGGEIVKIERVRLGEKNSWYKVDVRGERESESKIERERESEIKSKSGGLSKENGLEKRTRDVEWTK